MNAKEGLGLDPAPLLRIHFDANLDFFSGAGEPAASSGTTVPGILTKKPSQRPLRTLSAGVCQCFALPVPLQLPPSPPLPASLVRSLLSPSTRVSLLS